MLIDMKRLREKYSALKGCLDEARLRWWAAAEARSLGRGGVTYVAKATGLSRRTLHRGLLQLVGPARKPSRLPLDRVRTPGGGRKLLTELDPKLSADLEALVDPHTRGHPESPLRWTCKSTGKLAIELNQLRHRVSPRSVSKLLTDLDYSLQAMRKTREGLQHRDRDAQFRHINRQVLEFQAAGQPVISVDTKKKELIGDFAQKGREWQPAGHPEQAPTHDFPDPQLGKVAPYGVYDMLANQGWVSVGIDHDTAEFAVETIRRWWQEMGSERYPQAQRLLITADAGGSNGYRTRLWKVELQRLATDLHLDISVCHFPPGTSKWNKIEHRMFCHITQNWRGRPLVSRRAVVQLIGGTTTEAGLKIKAAVDINDYESGIKISKEEMQAVRLTPDAFHGEWNYKISR
jgi:Rhodopirellula transposase DDE domain